jgi:hypothetical protein
MPVERVLVIVLIGLSAAMLVRFGRPAVTSWRIYAGTAQRRQKDATARVPFAPPDVAEREAQLAPLGYRRLGVTSLDLPVGERFAWILAAEDGDSYVIVVPRLGLTGLTGIYSAWHDGMWLCTYHPRGEPVELASMKVQTVSTSLEAAVTMHRAELERLRAEHGDPRPVHSMSQMLALDEDYRVRFGGSRLRPLTIRIITPAILAAAMFAAAIALLVVSPR